MLALRLAGPELQIAPKVLDAIASYDWLGNKRLRDPVDKLIAETGYLPV